jgi:thiol-disulfide isomerase/thioredoxin
MVQTLGGKDTDLNPILAGKPTLLIFWATWCPSCRAEIPDFAGAYHRYAAKGLQVLAVDIGYNDPIEDMRQFVKARDLPYKILYDARQEAAKAYAIRFTPTVLLLNAAGDVVQRGRAVDEGAIQALLSGQESSRNQGGVAADRPVGRKLQDMAEISKSKMPPGVRSDVEKGIQDLVDSGRAGLSRVALDGAPEASLRVTNYSQERLTLMSGVTKTPQHLRKERVL